VLVLRLFHPLREARQTSVGIGGAAQDSSMDVVDVALERDVVATVLIRLVLRTSGTRGGCQQPGVPPAREADRLKVR
jgi:hypothetical protein